MLLNTLISNIIASSLSSEYIYKLMSISEELQFVNQNPGFCCDFRKDQNPHKKEINLFISISNSEFKSLHEDSFERTSINRKLCSKCNYDFNPCDSKYATKEKNKLVLFNINGVKSYMILAFKRSRTLQVKICYPLFSIKKFFFCENSSSYTTLSLRQIEHSNYDFLAEFSTLQRVNSSIFTIKPLFLSEWIEVSRIYYTANEPHRFREPFIEYLSNVNLNDL